MKKLACIASLVLLALNANVFAGEYEFVAVNWAGNEIGRFSTMDQCQWWIKGNQGASCTAVPKK